MPPMVDKNSTEYIALVERSEKQVVPTLQDIDQAERLSKLFQERDENYGENQGNFDKFNRKRQS